MKCKKCVTAVATVLLRKNDSYCENCFIINTNHKFRACIGKNKILSKNEKVLVCLSGGLSSTVLLDLIYNGISMDNHKKLRIVPSFLYLIDIEADSIARAEHVRELCNQYDFDLHMIHISQYMKSDLDLPTPNIIPTGDSATEGQFSSLMRSLAATTYNDFMSKIYRTLFIKCAENLGCSFIFTGEATTALAVHLLSNLALGRGAQVEHDVGFCDTRNKQIKIIKPIKDISQEELIYYSKIKQLCSLKNYEPKANSLQNVIGVFVSELQNTFPATISTVCKTADKIGNQDQIQKQKCVICESILGIQNSDFTALEATMFSRTVSNRRPEIADDTSRNNNGVLLEIKEDENGSLFPHINKELCYGCSRNYLEINKQDLPNHVKVMLHNKQCFL